MTQKPVFESVFIDFFNFFSHFSCIFLSAAVTHPCLPLCFLLLHRAEPGRFCLYTFPNFTQKYPSSDLQNKPAGQPTLPRHSKVIRTAPPVLPI